MYEITVEDEFSAVHFLKLYDGTWEKRHGHDWKVAVVLRKEKLDSMGVVADFEIVKPTLKKVLSELEKTSFNEHPYFKAGVNPSTENIAGFICQKMNEFLGNKTPKVSKVTVWETPNASASYYA